MGSGKTSNDGSETEYQSEPPTSAAPSAHISSTFPSMGVLSSEEEASDSHAMQERKTQIISNVFYPLVGIVLISWGLGAVGASWAWILLAIGCSWVFVKGAIDRVSEDFVRFESVRLQRRRALQSDETCEWLNLLLNRWWVFSSASIFNNLKNILDPRLQEAKPAFVEAISLKELSLGDRTPLLRSVRSWDATIPFRPSCSFHTPAGLALAPTHTLAVLCDLSLDSDSFSAVLAARVGHRGYQISDRAGAAIASSVLVDFGLITKDKMQNVIDNMGVDLDIGVEHLVLEGRVLVTLFLDTEAPFPHIARLTFSFTDRPKLSFRVKILKSVQMMEVPVLKTWLHTLVTDALATAWVDPGQLEVNIHSSEETFVPEQRPGDSLAQGVLTVMLRLHKGMTGSGLNTDEDKWVVVGVGGKTHVSPPFRSHLWQYTCSFLLLNPLSSTSLILKVKTKRLITTTLTQFDLALHQYGLDTCRVTETFLQKKGAKVMGGSVPPLHVRLEYTPLSPLSIDGAFSQPLDIMGNGAGVLYIVVHGADNLVSADPSPSPYCLVFNSRRKVKTTHFVSGSTTPRWECAVEVLVSDVAAVCLTFVVCSLPRNPKLQDGELLGIHTLNLSTIQLPLVHKQLPLNRNLSTPTPGDASPSGSTLTASIVFRCVPSVAGCSSFSQDNPNFKGMPLPMPIASGSPAGSPCLITSSSPNISISPPSSNPFMESNLRRSSTGVMENGEQILKKKGNSHWLNQAKNFLGSSHDNDGVRRQDLGDILASGLGLIEITIIRARDLVARDLNGYSDPYCVVKVNGEVKYRTRVKKKTLDPYWEEALMTHLPKKNQNLVITLWDHDAFGMKDFLGSLTLKEEEVRAFSLSGTAVWCKLDGVKTGTLEIKIKLISEDFEFESGSRCTSSVSNFEIGKKSFPEDLDQSTSRGSSLDSDSGREFMEKIEPESCLTKKTNDFKLSLPNRSHSRIITNGITNGIRTNNAIIKASSNPSLNQFNQTSREYDQEETKLIRARIDSLCTPSRTRKSGAEILASALALAKAESKDSLDSVSERKDVVKTGVNVISTYSKAGVTMITPADTNDIRELTPSPIKLETMYELESIQLIKDFKTRQEENFKPDKVIEDGKKKDLPKINLNDRSEDEYGLSDGSSEDFLEPEKPPREKPKAKKSSEGKRLRAVKDKVRRGFSHQLRRFRSEANMHHKECLNLTAVNIPIEDVPNSDTVSQSEIYSGASLGVGGGESDASELLAPGKPNGLGSTLLHARSHPNLSVKHVHTWTPTASPLSSQINSISMTGGLSPSSEDSCASLKTEKSSLNIKKQRASQGTFTNVRGVLRRVEGLHVTKPGCQLFVRIRISEERNGGRRTTSKTVGRSRLVPSSPCPVFECEWGAESDVSADAQIILEVRTSSRDLISSATLPLALIFAGHTTEGDVERWVDLEGGAQILLRAQFGGDAPPSTRRRSLFRSWSLHRIGKSNS